MTGAPPPPPPPPGGAPPPPPPPGGTPPPPGGGAPPPGYGTGPGYGGGYPPGYGGGYPPQPTKTNGMSIASLVLGLVGLPLCFIFIPSILAIIFGFVGLSQIKQDATQKGRGLAIAGIILGFVMIGFMILALAFGNTEFTFES